MKNKYSIHITTRSGDSLQLKTAEDVPIYTDLKKEAIILVLQMARRAIKHKLFNYNSGQAYDGAYIYNRITDTKIDIIKGGVSCK